MSQHPFFVLPGDKAEEIVTGLKGTIAGIHFITSGVARFSIQPKMKKKGAGIPEAIEADEHSCVILKEGKIPFQWPAPFEVRLGDKIRHLVTRVEGVVTKIDVSLNGCVHAEYLGAENNTTVYYRSPIHMIEIIGVGLPEEMIKLANIRLNEFMKLCEEEYAAAQAKRTDKDAPRPPGGPMNRVRLY